MDLPLYRPEQVRAMDAHAIAHLGVTAQELLERAGAAAWRELQRRWPEAQRIGVVCGPGNNGGDGYVLARLARKHGCKVHVLIPAGGHARSREAVQAVAQWRASGGRVENFYDELPEVDVWVDALYGTGLSRPPSDSARAIIERLNICQKPILAMDIPSGLDADSGDASAMVVRASATISFIGAKRGLYTGAARDYTGEVVLDLLGLNESDLAIDTPAAWLARPAALARWFGPRHANAHKGEHGHVLCVGGEKGMGGAVRLCAEAALRVGVGLASVATRKGESVAALLAARPEAMTHAVEDAESLRPLLARADVAAVGPGLGQREWGKALFAEALGSGKPLVLDADALNLLAQHWHAVPQAILTPHPGEAARLLECETAEIQRDRFAAAQALVNHYGAVVVLKGAGTIVAGPGDVPVVIGAGNPGMATGGMGDVLTGVIAALLAQGLPPFHAAVAGALLHGAAGDSAARIGGERGLLPSDLFPQLRRMVNPG